MPLNGSGPISIGGSTAGQSINLEFGRAAGATTSMSQLYRGGGIVGDGAPNVPTSGAISLSQFYGAANQFSFTISANQTNANLRTLAVNAGWDQSSPLVVTINSGVYISSNTVGTPGLTIDGSFPGGVSLTNNGFVVGMGGAGGGGGYGTPSLVSATAGGTGGLALSVGSPASITNNGTIAGGGGGGGGGGGAGYNDGEYTENSQGGGGGGGRSSPAANSPGGQGGYWRHMGVNSFPQNNGAGGTSSAAGGGGAQRPGPNSYTSSGDGASGGAWGAVGATGATAALGTFKGAGASGGSGGAAVSGNSNITWVATGTRLGAIA